MKSTNHIIRFMAAWKNQTEAKLTLLQQFVEEEK